MKDEYLHRTQQKEIVLNLLRSTHKGCEDSEISAALIAEIHEMEGDLLYRNLRISIAYVLEREVVGRFMVGIGYTSNTGMKDMPYAIADSIITSIEEYRRKLRPDES